MTSTAITVMPRSRTFMSSPCNSAWSETKPLSRSYVSCDASLLRASPPPTLLRSRSWATEPSTRTRTWSPCSKIVTRTSCSANTFACRARSAFWSRSRATAASCWAVTMRWLSRLLSLGSWRPPWLGAGRLRGAVRAVPPEWPPWCPHQGARAVPLRDCGHLSRTGSASC